jgi:hypothetical protein
VVSADVDDDIRTTSEEIKADAELLAKVEGRKQDPDASDDDLKRLSAQAVDLARRLTDKARVEQKLVDQATES